MWTKVRSKEGKKVGTPCTVRAFLRSYPLTVLPSFLCDLCVLCGEILS